jgi:hypothetical protein
MKIANSLKKKAFIETQTFETFETFETLEPSKPSEPFGVSALNRAKQGISMKISAKAVLTCRTNENGERAILLQVILNRKRINFPVGFYVGNSDFKVGYVKYSHQNAEDINRVIDDMKSRVVKIATEYYLKKRPLTPELLKKEFQSDEVNHESFINFARKALASRSHKLNPKTIEQNSFSLAKLENFKPDMTFGEITMGMIQAYEAHEKKLYGNIQNTVNKTLICWKHYLTLAEMQGIKFSNPFKFYKISNTRNTQQKKETA